MPDPRVLLAALTLGAIASSAALLSPAAASAPPKSLGRFGDWEAFVEQSGGAKVCYAATLPKQSKNAPKARARAYALVSDRPAEKSFGVVGITAGFALRKDAPAMLDIGGAKFPLYAVGDTAWTRDDNAVTAAMAKGRNATFVAFPAQGEAVADSYGLAGFAEARAAIDKECGAK